eukprot:5397990-Amphidinium_carterae.1
MGEEGTLWMDSDMGFGVLLMFGGCCQRVPAATATATATATAATACGPYAVQFATKGFDR